VDYLSVLHEEKRRTGSDSGAGEQMQQKKCQTFSDIGAEQENHNVGRGPTLDQKGLKDNTSYSLVICVGNYMRSAAWWGSGERFGHPRWQSPRTRKKNILNEKLFPELNKF
jgi:hypothetical protein